jgi:CheY-like chemotaxis protein/CRP-like cAMP-binding protein
MIVDLDLSPLTALVIDDSRYARAFARSALQSFGLHQIYEAGDGYTGIEILRERPVDLVLVDHHMAPISGIEFTRLVRTGAGGGVPRVDIPILMISGTAEMDTVTEARNAGVNEFLAKPLSPESLYRRIRNVLVNPRPFVRSEVYIGPCRRSIGRLAPGSSDRRSNPALPKPLPLVALPSVAVVAMDHDKTVLAVPQQARAVRRRFTTDAVVFSEGERSENAYIIETGRVKIVKEVNGVPVVVGRVGAHGVFGEMALTPGAETRMATAIAEEDTVCLVMPRDVLKEQTARSPELVALVLETLLANIGKMGRELTEVRATLRAKG